MKFLHESIRDLNRYKKILREAYGEMDANQDDMYQDDPRMMKQGGQGMMRQQMGGYEDDGEGEMGMPEGSEEQPMEDPQINGTIDQIRQLAIKGIAEYADDIESEQYQALKKIWLLTDKFYEDLNGDDDKKK